MRCLVTGGAGFIGSNLVDRLVNENHEVVIFDDLSTGKQNNINEKATLVNFDVSRNEYNRILFDWKYHWEQGFDVVFHLAAMTSVEESIHNPLKYHDVNVVGTLNILNACVEYKIKRFVFTSSSAVYGNPEQIPTTEKCELNPMSPYAMNKLMGEQYCKLFSELHGLETVCLRYANVFGERQRNEGSYCNVMGIFTQQKENGEKLTIVGDGNQLRDFIYVGDVVDANIKAGFNSKIPIFKCKGDVFNIGSGNNYSVNQIAKWIGGETINIPPRIEPKETLLDSSESYRVLGWKSTVNLDKWIKKLV